MTPELSPLQWYALRATYGRNSSAKAELEGRGLRVYVPELPLVPNGKPASQPLCRDLIFVEARYDQLLKAKRSIPFLHFMMERHDGTNRPIVVPPRQMEAFITAVEHYSQGLQYVSIDELSVARGTRIRIHGGALDGQEALFVKVQGRRAKRICLLVGSLLALTLSATELDYVEIL